MFDIVTTLYSGDCLGAVLAAFLRSLTWWDMILYGVTGTATPIVPALATDGAVAAAA